VDWDYTRRVTTRAWIGFVPSGAVAAVLAVAAATAVSWMMFPRFERGTPIMTYLLAIVVVGARYGRLPAMLTSLLGVAAFDFFFVPPYYTFAVADAQALSTFAVMLAVGLIIGGLTTRIRRQAESAADRERQTAALAAMTRELAQATTLEAVAASAAVHVSTVFDAEARIVLADTAARIGYDDALRVPLKIRDEILGLMVLRARRSRRLNSEGARRELDSFARQTALALERVRLSREAEAARISAETERLRNALLTSVSHDLRTPLAAITGAATTLLEARSGLDESTRTELLEAIRDETGRLNRLVQNLLQMTRLESGELRLQREWHPLEEVIGAALERFGDQPVTLSVPRDLPLVPVDDVLIEQVIVNLLDNAVKYAGRTSPIRILATATDQAVTVEVADRGPGLPADDERRVFDKFYRSAGNGAQGTGLGLAICRGIVQAHGGRIWAQNLPEGGVAFLFTLPLTGVPPLSVPRDA
jgi:two-component system, OmpR family, sensor histidine kinase KdpD